MIEANKESHFNFRKGRHDVFMIVDRVVRNSDLVVELIYVKSSKGVAELIAGP